MSQGSQGPFVNGRLSLPLFKFSYATVHGESTTPIPWIHLGRENNLFAIFETQPAEDGVGQLRDSRKFKVVQGPHVMEDVDLDVLAREAIRAKAEAQESVMSGKVPSVTVIVKIPCVAIRYPLEGGQIRRIQIRLASDDDYYETLKILTRTKVPFGDAGSFPAPQQQQPRPFSSSSSLLRPSDSASNSAARPASVSSNNGGLSGIQTGASAGWASASSLRHTINSGLLPRSPYETASSYFGQDTGGITSNSGRSSIEASTFNNPSNGLVSGYFANQSETHVVPPLSRSAVDFVNTSGGIDLYQPRPSTAPIGDSQHLSRMLPPKRKLPFPTSPPRKRAKKTTSQRKAVSVDTGETLPSFPQFTDLKNSVSDAVSVMETTSQVSTQSAPTVPASKKKRAAASRSPHPRAPKKQPAKAPARQASKAPEENDDVPSVEQLLEIAREPLNKVEEAVNTIDTQALLLRAEATRPYRSIELPDASEKQAASGEASLPSSQTRKCHTCRSRKGKCDGDTPCEWCRDFQIECTYDNPAEPSSQILVPSSQPETSTNVQTKQAESSAGQSCAANQRPGDTASQTEVPEVIPQESVANDKQDAPERKPNAPQPIPDHPIDADATLINATPVAGTHINAMNLLLREPPFAATQHLASWASLPESVQRSTLDTWMCQQFGDPAFIALMKRIDESWQANMFGRSVGVE